MLPHRIKSKYENFVYNLKSSASLRQLSSLQSNWLTIQLECNGLGLGAIWLQALYLQTGLYKVGKSARIQAVNSPYAGETCFDPISSFWNSVDCPADVDFSPILDKATIRYLAGRPSYGDFEYPFSIWSRAYKWAPSVESEFRTLLSTLSGNNSYAAVHYRGTDKSSESSIVEYSEILAAIQRLTKSPRILVFSDDESFLKFFRSELQGRAIEVPTKVRRLDNQPIHLTSGCDGPDAAWDAAFAVYAFSKSEVLIKTPSTLSGFAPILNPNLQVIPVGHLRKDFSFFPDRLIHETR